MIAVAIVLLLAYTTLFVSGELLQFRVSLTNEVLPKQAITYNGPFPNPLGKQGNVTLSDSDGRVFFFYTFRFGWTPFGNYTNQVLFVGQAPLCPRPGVALSSLVINYEYNSENGLGGGPPELYFDAISFAYHPSVIADTPFPEYVYLTYSDLQKYSCQYIPLEFVTISYPNDVLGVQYRTYPYNYTIRITVSMYDTNATATPFIGHAYSGSISIPIDVSANGTVTVGK